MAKNEIVTVRRNTAFCTQSLVEISTQSMLRDEVPEGAQMFSFDPMLEENFSLVAKADDDATREWEQHTTEPFRLVNWVCKKIQLEASESKELVSAVRVVMIDDEGETLAFVSAGILASLDLLRALRGDGPYAPPIPLTVRAVKTRRGFKTMKLDFIATPKAAKSK